jgi:hypothetical protein
MRWQQSWICNWHKKHHFIKDHSRSIPTMFADKWFEISNLKLEWKHMNNQLNDTGLGYLLAVFVWLFVLFVEHFMIKSHQKQFSFMEIIHANTIYLYKMSITNLLTYLLQFDWIVELCSLKKTCYNVINNMFKIPRHTQNKHLAG